MKRAWALDELERLAVEAAPVLGDAWTGPELHAILLEPDVAPLVSELLSSHRYRRSELIAALTTYVGPLNPSSSDADTAALVADALAGSVASAKEGDSLARYVGEELRARLETLATADGIDALSTLRRLSTRAARETMTVGSRSTSEQAAELLTLSEAFWVSRTEVEASVLGWLRAGTGDGRTGVLIGEPGSGKSSLLWRVHAELREDFAIEPLFIKASALVSATAIGGGVAMPVVSRDTLLRGTRAASALGRQPVLLIDTVDILLHTESGRELVLEVLEMAAAEGAVVLVSSRPAEATAIRNDIDRVFNLGDYSDAELSAALSIHVRRFYRGQPEADAQAQLGRLTRLVARQVPVEALLRRPLLMRMIFEVYAPAVIPEELGAFRLYSHYWDRRVKAEWRAEATMPSDPTDLGSAAKELARGMLAAGVPELTHTAASAAVGPDALNDLTRRGVLKDAETLGTVAFFHQTFFEHAAGRLIGEPGGTRLAAAVDELLRRGDDLFLAPVVEQAALHALLADEPAAGAELIRLLNGTPTTAACAARAYGQAERPISSLDAALKQELLRRPAGPVADALLDVMPNAGPHLIPSMAELLAVLWATNTWAIQVRALDRASLLASQDPDRILGFASDVGAVARVASRPPSIKAAATALARIVWLGYQSDDEATRRRARDLAIAIAAAAPLADGAEFGETLAEHWSGLVTDDDSLARAVVETMKHTPPRGRENVRAWAQLLGRAWRTCSVDLESVATGLDATTERRVEGYALGFALESASQSEVARVWATWLAMPVAERFEAAKQVWATVLSGREGVARSFVVDHVVRALDAPSEPATRRAALTALLSARLTAERLKTLIQQVHAFDEPASWFRNGEVADLLAEAWQAGVPSARAAVSELKAGSGIPAGAFYSRFLDVARHDPHAAEAFLVIALRRPPGTTTAHFTSLVRASPDTARSHGPELRRICLHSLAATNGRERRLGWELWSALIAEGVMSGGSAEVARLQHEQPAAVPHAFLGVRALVEHDQLAPRRAAELAAAFASGPPGAAVNEAQKALAYIAGARPMDFTTDELVAMLFVGTPNSERVGGLAPALERIDDAQGATELAMRCLSRAHRELPGSGHRNLGAFLRHPIRRLMERLPSTERCRLVEFAATLPVALARPIIEAAALVRDESVATLLGDISAREGSEPALSALISRRRRFGFRTISTAWPAAADL